jgi:methionine-gamma-lyase
MTDAPRTMGPSTASVHAGERPPRGPLEQPIVLSSAFAFASAEEAEGAFRGENEAYIYGRWGNPNVDLLERKLAALEGAEDAAISASGMSAIGGAMLALLRAGDHIVAPRALYGETARLFRERLPRLGITTTFLDETSPDAYRAAMTDATRLVYLETPSNPTLLVTDIAAVAAVARERGALSMADNTFAHSMTKFLCGHGDAIGGVVLGCRELVTKIRDATIKGYGAALSPFGAFLIERGVRTFALRMERATSSACVLAQFLLDHPAVSAVHHPSLPGHPGHAIAKRQMRAFPAILSFELRAGEAAARRVRERVALITHAVSLGDTRTLITHPASTTASTMPAEDRARVGIGDALLRLAVGIEDADDLVADLAQALAH